MENFLKAYKRTNRCEQSVTIFMKTIKSVENNQLQTHSNFSVKDIKTFITRIIIIALVLMIDSISGISQKEDHVWMFGLEYGGVQGLENWGSTNFDFNYDPVRIYEDPNREWDMDGANTSICDKDGNLIAYSNGQVIIHASNTAIADTINYGADIPDPSVECIEWEYNNYGDENMAIPGGMLGSQNVTILPVEDIYYTIYNTIDYCRYLTYKLSFTNFKINDLNPNGKIIDKDVLILRDTLLGQFTAIRHGNGRDWWVVTFSNRFDVVYTFLIDGNCVHKKSTNPTGLKTNMGSIGQITFSPDGRHLAFYLGSELFSSTGGGVAMADFDRCDGNISNLRSKTLSQPRLGFGTAFSSDSRYLFVCNGEQIFQYDMTATNTLESEKKVAEYDGYEYFFPEFPNLFGYPVSFCLMKLGPDGRIYIFPSSAQTRMLSVIDHPTEAGIACNIRQHSISMPTTFARTVPSMPEYRLGPLDGSPCDTLGLDNHPIAKYRYEPDTIDYLRIRFTDLSYFRPEAWSWDFGDGSLRVNTRHPYHNYAASGTYNVCLTVSNENSSNTSCRTITIGTSSIDDGISAAVADITLFPNPVEDYLLVTLGEYIPQHGQIMIFDISGRLMHTQRIYYGQNNVDMMQLAKGMYVWKVMDGKGEIRSGKVVKI
ncbi:MAG TPA: PKD domain-containing protein [Saprospiraceae bacterium]|nr:PKD domain-containing protein [Saprospiraceae bacterium]